MAKNQIKPKMVTEMLVSIDGSMVTVYMDGNSFK